MYISSYSLEDDPPEAIKECIEAFQEKFFKELFSSAQKGKFWVAGGCMRNYWENTEPRDIDIYTVDAETRAFVMSSLTLHGAIQIADSAMSTVYELDGLQFDIIKKHFSGPEETLWDFDLSPALCATDGESLFFEEHYFLNLANRSLVLHNARGGNTIERIIRYSQQGFSMSRAEVKKLTEELGIEDIIPEIPSSTAPNQASGSGAYPAQLPSSGVSKSKLSFKKIWPKKKEPAPIYVPGTVFTGGGYATQTLPNIANNYPHWQIGGGGMVSAGSGQTQLNIPIPATQTVTNSTSMYAQPGGGEVEGQPF